VDTVKGPKQELNDSNNCGVFVLWFLCALKLGRAISDGSILSAAEVISPLEVRTQIYHRLQVAPRKARETANPGTDDGEPVLTLNGSKGQGTPTINADARLNASQKEREAGPMAPELESTSHSNQNAEPDVQHTPTPANSESPSESRPARMVVKGSERTALASNEGVQNTASTSVADSWTDSLLDSEIVVELFRCVTSQLRP
jgi:hypothetical protein